MRILCATLLLVFVSCHTDPLADEIQGKNKKDPAENSSNNGATSGSGDAGGTASPDTGSSSGGTSGTTSSGTGGGAASPTGPQPAGPIAEDSFFIGSVSEDTTSDLSFWETNKTISARYIYINGGFEFGWRTWGSQDGDRAKNYIRNSHDLGMTPVFVYYQIPGTGDGLDNATQHIQDPAYMTAYFQDLKFFLDIVKQEGGDQSVGIVLEPDTIGYMMQLSGKQPGAITAQTNAAYSSGVLKNTDPTFPDTLTGLVTAINYIIQKYAPNALFGWMFNVWASPGIHHSIPGNGICHMTDSLGIAAGRQAIRDEAQEVAKYYKEAGVLEYGATWIFLDKFGLDGAGFVCNDPENNPSACPWLWNSDHWNNYVTYAEKLHTELVTPVVLWQIPVGHLNDAQGTFPVLTNTTRHYEDSAPTFILGDTFRVHTQARSNYFGNVADPKTHVNGDQITIESHIPEMKAAGIGGVLFGAGVGESTDFDSDGGWWIAKVKDLM